MCLHFYLDRLLYTLIYAYAYLAWSTLPHFVSTQLNTKPVHVVASSSSSSSSSSSQYMFTEACTFLLQICEQLLDSSS